MKSIFHETRMAGIACLGVDMSASRCADEDVYLSPLSDSVESPDFEVISPAAVVRAFHLQPGQRIAVEMVHGNGVARITGPVVIEGVLMELDTANTVFAVNVPGRYRLVAHGVSPGSQMPTVVVSRRNGWTMALT
jgi:hypothetical protein